MTRRAILGLLAAGAAAATAVGVVVYEERKASAAAPAQKATVAPGGVRGILNPHIIGSQKNVALNDGTTNLTVAAAVGDVLNISLPISAFVLSAQYGQVQWGTGAAYGSKGVSVQVSGPTAISIIWNDPNVPANYATLVKVTT
jgi:hypothetical protein